MKKNKGKIREAQRVLHWVQIFFISHYDSFLKKMERALYVWLANETQKWLSVSGALARKMTMLIKAVCKLYLKSKNVALKVLLTLDNALDYPQNFGLIHPYIQVEYLPHTTI
jgi:hypothetical protein